MNYSSLLGLAKQTNKEKTKQPIKGFSTEITPAKKPPRSHVPSANVRAFLAKQEQQAKDKVVQARKDKEKLLALRAQNTKSNKAAKLMASRTKDNDFSRIRLTEDQVETRDKVEQQLKRQVILDKVERMKARIKLEEHEAQLPHKRKRKPKAHPDDVEACSPSPPPSPPPSMSQSRPNMVKKPQRPAPPPMSFQDLIKMAAVKQFEPEDDVPEVEEERPLTKAERMEEEYRRYKLSGGPVGRTAFEQGYIQSQKKSATKKKTKGAAKGEARTQDTKLLSESVERSTDVRSNNAQRANDSRNLPQNRNKPSSNDTRNYQQSNGNRGEERAQENRNIKQKQDDRRVPQNGSFRGGPAASDNRNIERKGDGRNVQRTTDIRNGQRAADNRTPQRAMENKTVPRNTEKNSMQRFGENKSGGNSRPPSSSKSGYQTSENNNNNGQFNGNNRPDNRSNDARAFSKPPDRPGLKPKVPSANVQPHRTINDRPNSDPQRFKKPDTSPGAAKRKAPPTKHESAFRNSLPPKKPRLDTQPREHEIIQEKPVTNFNRGPTKSSLGSRPDPYPRGQPDMARKPKLEMENRPRQQVQKPNIPPRQDKPVIKSKDSRSVNKTKVMLNENWLEEEEEGNNARIIMPKKKLSVPSSNVPQNRPIEQDRRQQRPQERIQDDRKPTSSQRMDGNRRPEERRPLQQDRRSEQASNIHRSQERQDVGRKKQLQPQKMVSESRENDYQEMEYEDEEELYEEAPRRSIPAKRPVTSDMQRKMSSGPTGSRRPLDTPIPVKSMARNPNKLPPIRTSKLPPIRTSKLPPIRSSKCSYIKSDSEDDEDDEYEEEEEDDMADFIDDGPQPRQEDVSKHIRAIFGYDKRRYLNEDEDDEVMESSYAQQMKEEARSMRIGRMEDIEEEKKELERKLAMLKRKR